MNQSTANHNDEGHTGRVSDQDRTTLLDLLDKQDAANTQKSRYGGPWLSYRRSDVRLHLVQPGGGSSDSVVDSRNLSAKGICVLYTGFVHTHTRAILTLRRRLGGDERVEGFVHRCRLVSGVFHEICIMFDCPIFPELYLDDGNWSDLIDDKDTNPSTLCGHVLLVADQKMDRALFKARLKSTQVKVTLAEAIPAAVAELQKCEHPCIELVVCDLNVDSSASAAAVTALRAGYSGPILVVTAETSPAYLHAATAAGACATLLKPYDSSKLYAALASWLQPTAGGSDGPLYSETTDPDVLPLIGEYIEEVLQNITAMRAAVDANDVVGVRAICQRLKGTGVGYGFPMLSTVAKEVVTALDASMSVSESLRELRRLRAVAVRLRAGQPEAPVPEVRQVLVH